MKKRVSNIILFSISFLIVIVLLDIFAQNAYIETKSPTDFTDEYGRCRKANMNYVFFTEGFSMGKFNKGRYLNSFYPIEKPNNTIRIAALGDSFVEGFQVFERNHFLKLTEQKLNEQLKDSVQILNFGRSGLDFGDMYAYYERMVKDYEPDIVLFFLSNADLNIKQTDPLIPRVIETDSGLQITNSRMPSSYLQLFKKQLLISDISVLFKMLNDSRKLIKSGMLLPKLFDKLYFKKSKINHNNSSNTKISNLSFKITDNLLRSSETKFYIINRDRKDLYSEFISNLNPNFIFMDIKNESEIYKSSNPHLWEVTSKEGHWNMEAHNKISVFLTKKIIREQTK